MKSLLIMLMSLTTSLLTPAHADEVADYYASLRVFFAKHYPKVTAAAKDDGMTFDFNTRTFLVHELTKDGAQWQDAAQQRGPNPGGIYCEIQQQKGPYDGQAKTPQTFDRRYFRVLLLAPYSKRLDRHLHILLYYPQTTDEAFLRDFTHAANRFSDL